MATDDDDQFLTSEAVDTDRNKGQEPDLSTCINQGRRVADLRMLADLSPQVLATKAGLTLFELQAIEAGRMILSRDVAERLSAQLGVRCVDLWISSVS